VSCVRNPAIGTTITIWVGIIELLTKLYRCFA